MERKEESGRTDRGGTGWNMELIKISDTKLKITLTKDDMIRYELNCDTIDYDNTETRKAFWNILDHAKHVTGFDAASERVFIQLYPDKGGGCEMYVTKLGLSCLGEPGMDVESGGTMPMEKGNMALRPLARPSGERDRLGAYRFENLDRLLCVCRQLAGVGYPFRSSAYRDDGGRYYLLLRERTGGLGASFVNFSFITEFGICEDADTVKVYIGEHGSPICEGDAVGVLSKC